MRTFAAALLALAGTAALAQGQPQTNPFNAQLRALDPLRRMASIRRAVISSGGRCTRVTIAQDDGLYGNLAKWSVRCGTDGDYAIFLGPGGEVQMRECSELKGLKLPACTLPPPAPAEAPKRR